jgi:hypothetical protein
MSHASSTIPICPICRNAVLMGIMVGEQMLHFDCTQSRFARPISVMPSGWKCPSCDTIHAPSVLACHCNSPVVPQ